MVKTIYIEPEEEITSVIDKLIATGAVKINLIIPLDAQIWQSSINLKLLKREVGGMGKEVRLIAPDDLTAEMAVNIGFAVKKEKDLPVEFIQEETAVQKSREAEEAEEPIEEPEEEIEPGEELVVSEPSELGKPSEDKKDIFGQLVAELESENGLTKRGRKKFLSFIKKADKDTKSKMVDIMTPGGSDDKEADINIFRSQSNEKKPANEKGPAIIKEEPVAKSPQSPLKKEVLQEEIIVGDKPTAKREPMGGDIGGTPSINRKKTQEEEITGPRSFKWPKLFAGFVVLAVVVAGVAAYKILPTAELILYPTKEKISMDLFVSAEKDNSFIDKSNNSIPLEEMIVEETGSREFSATGEEDVIEKARGSMIVFNEYSSSPQVLVATTRFESPDGKIFRIEETITIPGAEIQEGKIIPSSLTVEVVADQPGEEYNIEPTNFTIPGFEGTPKFAGFYGKTKGSMEGGAVGTVKVVSSEDLEKAKEELGDELGKKVSQVLYDQIPDDLRVVGEGIREDVELLSSSAEEGDNTESFTIEMKGVARALLYKEEDMKSLIELNLSSQVSEDKTFLSETQDINISESTVDWEKGRASFDLFVEEEIAWQLDAEKLKDDLLGQNEVEVRQYINKESRIEKAKVTFWPFWVKKIPKQRDKVEIIIKSVESID